METGYVAAVIVGGEEKTPEVEFTFRKPTIDAIRDRPREPGPYKLQWLADGLVTWNFKSPDGSQRFVLSYQMLFDLPKHVADRIEQIMCGGLSDRRPEPEAAPALAESI